MLEPRKGEDFYRADLLKPPSVAPRQHERVEDGNALVMVILEEGR